MTRSQIDIQDTRHIARGVPRGRAGRPAEGGFPVCHVDGLDIAHGQETVGRNEQSVIVVVYHGGDDHTSTSFPVCRHSPPSDQREGEYRNTGDKGERGDEADNKASRVESEAPAGMFSSIQRIFGTFEQLGQ